MPACIGACFCFCANAFSFTCILAVSMSDVLPRDSGKPATSGSLIFAKLIDKLKSVVGSEDVGVSPDSIDRQEERENVNVKKEVPPPPVMPIIPKTEKPPKGVSKISGGYVSRSAVDMSALAHPVYAPTGSVAKDAPAEVPSVPTIEVQTIRKSPFS